MTERETLTGYAGLSSDDVVIIAKLLNAAINGSEYDSCEELMKDVRDLLASNYPKIKFIEVSDTEYAWTIFMAEREDIPGAYTTISKNKSLAI